MERRAAASNRIIAALLSVSAILSVLFIGVYITIALSRSCYPFSLEWLEGEVLASVARIVAGQPIYTAPTLDHISLIYTPLYFYICALPAAVMGLGFPPLRFVSIACSLGTLFLLFRIVQRESGSPLHGLTAAGLFAATYPLSGAWFDLARVDSAFLFFLLLSIYLVRFGSTAFAAIAAGAAVSAAFLTKQTALALYFPLLVCAGFEDRRRGLIFAGTSAALISGGLLVLQLAGDGWFLYYTFLLPARDVIATESIVGFWWRDFFRPLPLACLVAVGCLAAGPAEPERRPRRFYLLACGALVAISWLARIHKGGYINVLMPAHAAVAILFGLGLARAASARRNRDGRPGFAVLGVAAAAAVIQLLMLAYLPGRHIPTAADRRAGHALVERLARIEGRVLVPSHPFLPVMAGKPFCASRGAMIPIINGAKDEARRDFVEGGIRDIRNQRFAAIVLDKKRAFYFSAVVEEHYEKVTEPLFDSEEVFWTRTGVRTRPRFFYLPRRNTALGRTGGATQE